MRIIDGRILSELIPPLTIEESDLKDGAVTTAKLASSAVTSGKVADSAVVAGKIADGGVDTPARLADSIVVTAKIADGDITNPKLDSLFQSENLVAVDSVGASTNFPTTFADTPVVVAVPGPGVTWTRVTAITPGSFEWIADAAGSASWFAWGHRS